MRVRYGIEGIEEIGSDLGEIPKILIYLNYLTLIQLSLPT